MNRATGLIFLVLAGTALAGLAGCDQPEGGRAVKPVAKSSTQPATVPASTQGAQPPLIHMAIGGEDFGFPSARLRLVSKDGAIMADLYSDDPKEALDDRYTGNSFYLVMPLEGDDPRRMTEATWIYKSASGSTRADTTTGIFLFGTKYRLQPYEVAVEVLSEGPIARVIIRGQFLRFETKQDGLPTTVSVSADIRASIEYK